MMHVQLEDCLSTARQHLSSQDKAVARLEQQLAEKGAQLERSEQQLAEQDAQLEREQEQARARERVLQVKLAFCPRQGHSASGGHAIVLMSQSRCLRLCRQASQPVLLVEDC